MADKSHWEKVYSTRAIDDVSWYQTHAERSLKLIRELGIAKDAPIIDVGGGASVLVGDLLDNGYSNLAVLDLSAAALCAARARLGGHVIVATFAEDGPTECSGLPVMRYDAAHLHGEFGAPFELLGHERETHLTPAGRTQSFLYCFCRRQPH